MREDLYSGELCRALEPQNEFLRIRTILCTLPAAYSRTVYVKFAGWMPLLLTYKYIQLQSNAQILHIQYHYNK